MLALDFQSRSELPIVLGLGFFDSVHYGHRKIIERVVALADRTGATPALFTFGNNAYKQFNATGKLIYTLDERKRILEQIGIACVVAARFDKAFKATDRKDFLDALFDRFSIRGIVCGYDYLFGAGGAGDCEYLKTYCATKGVALEVVDKIELDGERVSSTEVKRLLSCGDVEKANRFLVDPFSMTGTVVAGRGEGHLFGFPTANLAYPSGKLTPACGVYATRTTVDGKTFKSVTNVGNKPTFGDMRFSVETFVSGEPGDLYGKTMTLKFIRFLRSIRKFDSPEQLRAQIHSDMEW